jgi:cellulose synthase/poly-beta-1,6-N-acetylglucosamine synthase-like glycosyltransferase
MLWFVVTFVLVLGLSTLWWAAVGVGRRVVQQFPWAWSETWDGTHWTPDDVAILIAARNEELVLPATLQAALRIVGPRQLFVVSDASTDGTAEIARAHGARVLELTRNRGKAGALEAGIRHFDLPSRFAIVMLLDADTLPAPDYLSTGLPLFNHRDVVAVAGRALTLIDDRPTTLMGSLLLAHRERTYVAMQTLHKFGQAARMANAVSIVPGFASMYRTNILDRVDITAPGLAIEDYNMTFEIHSKRLGRVAFDPTRAHAYTQDPDTLVDYRKQMHRWSLGFWQTLMRHRVQFRTFWIGVLIFAFEVLMSSVLLLLLVPLVALLATASVLLALGFDPHGVLTQIDAVLPLPALVLGVLVPDLVLTIYAAIATRRLRYLLFAPAFPVLRVLDAALCLKALRTAIVGSSNGVWSSPARR